MRIEMTTFGNWTIRIGDILVGKDNSIWEIRHISDSGLTMIDHKREFIGVIPSYEVEGVLNNGTFILNVKPF